jgi:hypothetical protein
MFSKLSCWPDAFEGARFEFFKQMDREDGFVGKTKGVLGTAYLIPTKTFCGQAADVLVTAHSGYHGSKRKPRLTCTLPIYFLNPVQPIELIPDHRQKKRNHSSIPSASAPGNPIPSIPIHSSDPSTSQSS